jgi:hypothetical protein
MSSCAEPAVTNADLDAAGSSAKQQKLASTSYSSNPLSEAGVLQLILGYVGPGH